MAKTLPKLACALLAFAMLGQKTTAQSLFAKAKEDSNKSLEVYVATLKDYFSRWSSLMLAEPVKGEDGQPEIHVNPAQRRLDFTMKISVNEEAYSAWKSEAFRRLTEAGISEAGGDGILIGGKTWAFPNKQGIEAWQKDVETPRMTFRAMLVDAQGAEVRSLEFHEEDVRKREIVKTEYEAMLRSWTEVKTNSVSTLPLYWLGRMKDYPSFESTNWLNKKQDGDSCFVWVGFENLTDDEMERAANVKCVILGPNEIENERIQEMRAFWNGQGEEANRAALSLLADLIKIKIVGGYCALGIHTVSQSQWEAIMDSNPVESSEERGADKPVVGAEAKSIMKFIDRVNAHPALCDSGIKLRIPTVEEWKTAALAGKPGKLIEDLYSDNRNLERGFNEWGFCDILAGCWELVAKYNDKSFEWKVVPWGYACTGHYFYEREGIITLSMCRNDKYWIWQSLGIRLCADWTPELEVAIAKAKKNLSTKMDESSPEDIVKTIIQEMINVPGTSILIGKYEVSQTQWEAVMGSNPSKHQGKQFPVETLSKDQVFEFISKLNGNPAIVKSGLMFRLPTEKEWRTAAVAGGLSSELIGQRWRDEEITYEEHNALREKLIENGKLKKAYGLLADGSEGKPDDVAWHGGDYGHPSTAKGMTHPIGKKIPNAFGFYDMCGNVAEIASRDDHAHPHVAMGGCWESKPEYCSVDDDDELNVWNSARVGLRLCAERSKPGIMPTTEANVDSQFQSNAKVDNGGESPIVLDAVDIVFQVLRDKVRAEQLIRNQLGNDVNDVIIRAEGLDDDHVRGHATDVVLAFTHYFQMHGQEIVKKARGKAGLK